MILYTPKPEDLWFRKMFMADEATMSYNHNWGGTIPFPEEQWQDWYDYWIANPEGKRFYKYLQEESTGEFVGEIAYHFDEEEKNQKLKELDDEKTAHDKQIAKERAEIERKQAIFNNAIKSAVCQQLFHAC